MKLVENAVEKWAEEVSNAKKRELTKEEAELLVRAHLNEKFINSDKEAMELLEGGRCMASVFWKRMKLYSAKVTPAVALVAEMFIGGNFGKSTMIAAYLTAIAKKQSLQEIDMSTFSIFAFPWGVPTEEEWQRLWQLQKLEPSKVNKNSLNSDNGLDYKITYKSLLDDGKTDTEPNGN